MWWLLAEGSVWSKCDHPQGCTETHIMAVGFPRMSDPGKRKVQVYCSMLSTGQSYVLQKENVQVLRVTVLQTAPHTKSEAFEGLGD